jgi:hypothetical protein
MRRTRGLGGHRAVVGIGVGRPDAEVLDGPRLLLDFDGGRLRAVVQLVEPVKGGADLGLMSAPRSALGDRLAARADDLLV